MEIRRSTLDTDSKIGRFSDRGDSLLADKISKLHIFFSLLKSNITEEEKQYLDPALVECYRRFGITFDNASLHNDDGTFKAMPDLRDLYELLCEKPEIKKPCRCPGAVRHWVLPQSWGSRPRRFKQTNIIVLDISELPLRPGFGGMFMAL